MKIKTIKVECHALKCKHQWDIEINEDYIEGNRIVMGPTVYCPLCQLSRHPLFLYYSIPKTEVGDG